MGSKKKEEDRRYERRYLCRAVANLWNVRRTQVEAFIHLKQFVLSAYCPLKPSSMGDI